MKRKYIIITLFLCCFFITAIYANNGKSQYIVLVNKSENTVVIGCKVTLENTMITYNNVKIFIHGREKRSKENLSYLIHSLNKIGAKPEDLIKILRILHRAGSLDGKLVIM